MFSWFLIENESNKLGMKDMASLLEYTYLDVKNLNDRDNGFSYKFL